MLSIRDKKANLDVVIEPMDPAVQKAVQKLKTMKKRDGGGYFDNVSKIIVHHGGGSGELGHVEMGPGKDPHEIHIFKDRIDLIVKNQYRDQKDPKALQDAIEMALIETIAHESEHIGRQKGDNIHFKTEPEAYAEGRRAREQVQQMFTNDAILNASLVLDDIRENFFPTFAMPEPNLSFIVRVATCDKKKVVKEAIELIKSDEIYPACFDIAKAIEFNRDAVKTPQVAKVLSIIQEKVGVNDHLAPDFVTALAVLQGWMGLEPNGMLDTTTVSKFFPVKEQNILEPTPNDMPFSNPYDIVGNHNYLTWTDTINNITPSMSLTTPILGPETY